MAVNPYNKTFNVEDLTLSDNDSVIPAYHSGFSGIITESSSNYGITARGKIITVILDYGNLVTSGNNR